MAVREILLLGNPDLHRVCDAVRQDEMADLESTVNDLHDTLVDFRSRHGYGRAIAAPQVGIFKRLIYMLVDGPVVFVNPELESIGSDWIELWDDCMSFPDLLVRVRRSRKCRLTYRNLQWRRVEQVMEDDLSELLQHECDHLDGVLAVARAVDGAAFALRSQFESGTLPRVRSGAS